MKGAHSLLKDIVSDASLEGEGLDSALGTYIIHCTPYTIHRTLFTVHRTPDTGHRTPYTRTAHATFIIRDTPGTSTKGEKDLLLDRLHMRLRRRIVADTAGYKSDLPKEALYNSGGGGGEYGQNQHASISALETSRVSVRTKFLSKTPGGAKKSNDTADDAAGVPSATQANDGTTFGPPKGADVDSMLRLLSGPEATRKVIAKESTDTEGAPDSGGLDALSRQKKGANLGGKPGKKVSSPA